MNSGIQGGPKKLAQFFLHTLTLPNINRFSKLFHCQIQEKICNNTITKDPTTPQVCRYTIPRTVRRPKPILTSDAIGLKLL